MRYHLRQPMTQKNTLNSRLTLGHSLFLSSASLALLPYLLRPSLTKPNMKKGLFNYET